MPPTFLFIFLLLSVLLHFIFPIKRIVCAPYNYLGVLVIGLGVMLNIWSDSLFKRKNIPIKPHDNPAQLETSGPFRISRHPMYLGMIIVLLGVSIVSGSLITFIFPVAFLIVMNRIFIPFEEKNLEHIFRKEYLNYKRKVRCWL
ncbi:MAG: isoprenylcysteine carboxylmethyltransferase family protein [Candidatus Omnitrophica bacterium]|nr:isoprenylcysteine carboxylmethyltransferase family protein [Candidatus Omnitrophota bacterium]